jgi:hypothetical protein
MMRLPVEFSTGVTTVFQITDLNISWFYSRFLGERRGAVPYNKSM